MSENSAEPHRSIDHTLLEDAQAFLLGTAMVALGVVFLRTCGLITGQTAGLAVLLSYLSGWSFGWVFFVLNAPFWILAFTRMGLRFTIKSAIAVALVSVMTELLPEALVIERLSPPVGALLAGATTGLGLMAVFRHGGSLGGIGVVALWLQETAGIRAGWVQLGFDAVLFLVAFFFLDTTLVLWSLLGAVVVNLIIGVNHRRDRYVAR